MAEYIVNISEDLGDFDFIAVESLRAQTPLIRCRECKWFDMTDPSGTVEPIGYRCRRVNRLWREPHDFCSRAERKEE